MEVKKRLSHMTADSANQLAGAIIKQAVTDYMGALIQDDTIMISECEKFFRSKDGWFHWLSNGLDGNVIMPMLKKKVAMFIKAVEEHQPERYGDKEAAKKASFTCPCCNNEAAPVTITFPKRKLRQPNVISYTCPSCHISVWYQWNTGVVLKEQSCNNCLFCRHIGVQEFCDLNRHWITKRRKNCRDWEGRPREEIS